MTNSGTPEGLSRALQLLDERHWLRMIACFLPGLVAGKLAGYFPDSSVFAGASTVLLVLGVAVYLCWFRLRPKQEEESESENEEDVQAVAPRNDGASGAEVLETLAALRAKCGEPERESDRLIAIELSVNPQQSFAEAARSALARRLILSK